jgi:hypothetical protein
MRFASALGHNITMRTSTPLMEGPVEYVVVPLTFGMRSGSMRLGDGRLTYTRKRQRRVVFDAPVGEFHSFARSSWGTGFHLWHGAKRHRFSLYHPVPPVEFGPGVPDWVEDVDQFGRSLTMQAMSRAEVDRWHDALVPVIAPQAPTGVRVRPPLSRAGFLAAALGFAFSVTLVVAAIVTAIVLAGL